MNYSVGDSVVLPGCGVGTVQAIQTMEMDGTDVEMYRIDLGEDAGKMWVPLHRAVVSGMRPVMTVEQAERTWQIIKAQEAPEKRANWNRRQRRYNEQLMSNEPEAMAELLGELAAVRSEKPLSFGERRLYERVKGLLTDEIAAALEQPVETVTKRMDEVVGASAPAP